MNFLAIGIPVVTALIGGDFIATNARWLREYNMKKKRCSSSRTVVAIDATEEADGTWTVSFNDYSSGPEQVQTQCGHALPPPIIPGKSYPLWYNPTDPGEQMPLTNEEYSIRRSLVLAGIALMVAGAGAFAIGLAWPH